MTDVGAAPPPPPPPPPGGVPPPPPGGPAAAAAAASKDGGGIYLGRTPSYNGEAVAVSAAASAGLSPSRRVRACLRAVRAVRRGPGCA